MQNQRGIRYGFPHAVQMLYVGQLVGQDEPKLGLGEAALGEKHNRMKYAVGQRALARVR